MGSLVNLVDEEISRQVNLNCVDELNGLTGLTINLEDHIPRSEFALEAGSESLDDAIDRIIHDSNSSSSNALLNVTRPTIIPDSLPPVDQYQTPVAASSSLSMSSALRMSMRARSSAEQQAGRFRRPTMTPLAAQGMRTRPIEAPSPCPNLAGSNISSSLFLDSSSQPDKPAEVKDDKIGELPPLALFDLSGSLPPTAQLFPPSDSGTLLDYSFKTTTGRTTGSSSSSLLVPATQYGPDVVDTAKLLPTTPTLPTVNFTAENSAEGGSVEIPPTQFPVSKAASQILLGTLEILAETSQTLVGNTQHPTGSGAGAMSQVDLFAANLVNTQGIDESIPGTLSLTDPSIAPTFSPAIIVTPDQPIEVILEEPECDVPYSGHEMVMLPDSLDEDEEENPFTVKEHPVVYSDVGRISEPPVLPSQAPPTQESYKPGEEDKVESRPSGQGISQEDILQCQEPTQGHPAEEPVPDGPTQVLEVPRTGKKVKFAPTPVDSSQPPPPMAVSVYRTRTDTQEMEEAFATGLTKFCQQIITVPRSEMTPVKDVDERLMAEGDIQMKPRTPLKIVARGATPVKPFASASKTLTRIIEAITPGKKAASSCVASKVSSPCPQRIAKATPTAKRTLAAPKSKTVAKKLKTSLIKKPNEEEGPLMISGSTLLGEGLLVWAHWRLQYFTAGTVEKKKSTRREVWQVRPFHRTSTTLDLSADHMLPLVLLEPGDTVLHITDRRSYKMQKRQFKCFIAGDEEGQILIEVEGHARLELKDVIIDRTLFTAKHKDWRASISAPPSSQPEERDMVMDREVEVEVNVDVENREPNSQHAKNKAPDVEPRYSPTGVGLFIGLSFVLTGSNDKTKLAAAIEEAGGTIVEDLTPESLPDPKDLILISTDTQPCRTAKYYCAVLLGLERLKAGWIEASLSKGKLAPFASYRLPPKPTRKSPVTQSPLFSDTFLSFIGSKSYKSSCTQIAAFTSATLVDPRRLASLKDRSVVVVLENAESLTPRLQATCLANGHLIAEKAWFTDSILQGRVLPLY